MDASDRILMVSVLNVLESSEKPRRFHQLRRATEASSAKLESALHQLSERLLVIPSTVPTKGKRMLVEYQISHRGRSVLECISVLLLNL